MEKELVEDLVIAYRLIALLGLDDLTYTHISVRSQENPRHYYMSRLGPLFSQVTSQDIVRMNDEGVLVEGRASCNVTGHNFHSALYRECPWIHAAFHLHTPHGVAVASQPEGLRPYSQWSYMFYERIGTLAYDGLALDFQKGLLKNENQVLILMENHGVLTLGKTLQEAFLYALFFEKAAQTQLLLMSASLTPKEPSPRICRKARDQMISFESDLGRRDWEALKKQLQG